MEKQKSTHSKLLCNLSAIGASGSIIVSHAFLTLTSKIALRVTFFVLDFAPRVATNLFHNVINQRSASSKVGNGKEEKRNA